MVFDYPVNSYEIACRHAYRGHSLSCRFNYLDDNKTIAEDMPKDFKIYTKFITELTLGISNLTAIPADTFDELPNLYTLVARADIQTISKDLFLNATKLIMLNFGYNNQLTQLESRLFEYVPTLEYIDIGYNQISIVEDEVFYGLDKLKTLYLEANLIEMLTNGTFVGADNLRILELSKNQIFDIGDGTFANLSKLRILQLNRNQIDSLQSNIFDGLNAIERLDLSVNLISTIEEGVFDKLATLKLLELGFNRLVTMPETIFSGMPNLNTLFLAYNRLRNIENLFANLTELKILDLSFNPLMTIEPALLSDMAKLTSLEFRGCNLTELQFEHFSAQTSLELLDLSENNLTTIDLMIFDPLDKLQVLKLEANRMSEIANFTEIKRMMPTMNFINLSRNEIDCDTVIEIIDYFKENDIDFEFGEEVDVGCQLLPFRSRNIQAYELSKAELIEQNKLADQSTDNKLNAEH